MGDGVTVLDFDHSYQWQAFLRDPSVEWIDLTDLTGTKRFCAAETLAVIRERLSKRTRRGVTLIGSGSYHYITYLLLAEIDRPFSLVLFDHHADMMEPPDESVVSCGSWVWKALRELPLLKQVFIIGVDPKGSRGAAGLQAAGGAARAPANDRQPLNTPASEVPSRTSGLTAPFRGTATPLAPALTARLPNLDPHLRRKVFIFEPVNEENAKTILPAIISCLSTYDVYISVDKDVLDPTEAITDWDQGTMKLAVLTRLIRAIADHRRVCGADICGEYPISPVDAYSPRHRLALRKNAQANRILLDTIRAVDLRSLPLSS